VLVCTKLLAGVCSELLGKFQANPAWITRPDGCAIMMMMGRWRLSALVGL
jgi:hypothetical protein